MKVKIKLVDGGKMPEFAHDGDACLDCFARTPAGDICFKINRDVPLVIPLGFCIEIPKGYEGVIRPRSGRTSTGMHVAIGTIDSNYRGEVCAQVYGNDQHVCNGDKICQLAIRKTEDVEFEQVDELSDSNRGTNGFGSTGL